MTRYRLKAKLKVVRPLKQSSKRGDAIAKIFLPIALISFRDCRSDYNDGAIRTTGDRFGNITLDRLLE